ncbi:hypothetical protein DAPPUDRAFT_316936 [Daphnia pulex]|uniref:Peptidase A2 domain-containing protein n=1 Tax=Daphnia pulex TaxID=6669 RepID=E9GEE8_DAPPU|nr:hypothetical protein DAPPUDRAFT_316936 [Daphnia pulex]|eukprot:EFX82254.1 hypothetical protein DAPPUDRAFT_316936 [Daphnia pulex]
MTEFKKYFLEMKLNGHDIGEPDLVSNGDTRSSATGVIPLKGGFLAKMNFAGIDFECPVQVSDDDNTRNLIGRRALPFLVDFDWNKFVSDGTNAMVSDWTPDNIKKQQLMDDALNLISKRFHVKVSVDHKHFGMILDTGATCSIAGLAKWKELGEPHINPVNRSVESTSNQFIPILGECSLNIKYNGTEAQLPLLIADSDEIPAILDQIQFLIPHFKRAKNEQEHEAQLNN